MRSDTIYIWDSVESLPTDGALLISWNDVMESEKFISIPNYVSSNEKRLKQKILTWTFELSNKKVLSRKLYEYFSLGNGFSYWWMSPFIEKHPYGFPIKEITFLFALNDILSAYTAKGYNIKVNTAHSWLLESVIIFCRSNQIHCENVTINKLVSGGSKSRNRGFIASMRTFFRQVNRTWKLKKSPSNGWIDSPHSALLSSYFINFDKNKANEGEYHSAYWGDFPEILRNWGYNVNWLHHNSHFSESESLDLIAKLNQNGNTCCFHSFAENKISIFSFIKIFTNWVWLCILSVFVVRKENLFKIENSGMTLWPLLKELWYDWIVGPLAFDNLFMLESFQSSLGNMTKQKIGLYICENNSFERAFIHSWKKHNHGFLIGVQHSTLRFWDLRYFNDIRILNNKGPLQLPQPDLMAINGPAAKEVLDEVSYPSNLYVPVEAIRYLNYADPKKLVSVKSTSEKRILLVLGDISFQATANAMELLFDLPDHFYEKLNIILKPHPVCKIEVSDFPRVKFEIFNGNLASIFKEDGCIVFGSNPTSSCLDAYLNGIPIIVHKDPSELNMNPLQKVKSVRFVGNSFELASNLSLILDSDVSRIQPDDFFWLDMKYSKWRSLINMVELKQAN